MKDIREIDYSKYDGQFKKRIPEEEIVLYENIIKNSWLYKRTENYRGKDSDCYNLAYCILCEKYPEEKERFNVKEVKENILEVSQA